MKEEHNRDNLKKNITETALKMFLEKGIKDVKMDDLASLLSISKRTLYELYNDKEQLLYESVKLNGEIMRSEAKKRIREARNVLEIVLGLYSIYFEKLKSVNKKFFTEIEKYPNIYKHNKEREAKNYKRFIAWMESGRDEGLFRKDANFEILLYILRRDLNTIFKVNTRNEDNELAKYTSEELGRTLILFYLRGISTQKGQEIIEMYLRDNEKRT